VFAVDLPSADDALFLSGVFNGGNGEPLTEAEGERLVIANENRGVNRVSQVELSKVLGISQSAISGILKEHNAKRELLRSGVDGEKLDSLSSTIIKALKDIPDDSTRKAAADLIADAGLKTTAARAIFSQIKDESSEADRNAVVAAAKAAIESETHAPVVNSSIQAGASYGRLRKLYDDNSDAAKWVPTNLGSCTKQAAQLELLIPFLVQVIAEIDGFIKGAETAGAAEKAGALEAFRAGETDAEGV